MMQTNFGDVVIKCVEDENDHHQSIWSNSYSLLYQHMNAPITLTVQTLDTTSSNRIWGAGTIDPQQLNYLYFGGLGRPNYPSVSTYSLTKEQWIYNANSSENLYSNIFPLWGITTTLLNNKIYIFGGFDHSSQYNTIHEYDLLNQSLQIVPATGEIPKHRAGASAIACNRHIIIFGGSICVGGPYQYYNDVCLFNTTSKQWKHIKCSGDIPTARSQHCSVLVKRMMVVIAGYDGSSLLNDVHTLNLETAQWKKEKVEGQAPKRIRLSPTNFKIYPSQFAAELIYTSGRKSLILVYGICGTKQFRLLEIRHINENENEFTWKTIATSDVTPDLIGSSLHKIPSNYPGNTYLLYGKSQTDSMNHLYKITINNAK
jgi:hypothetical protein